MDTRPPHSALHPEPTGTRAPQGPMPWVALGTMALTVFIAVSGEMMPTAVLPELAADLDVPLARAGMLVSAWAATVVVASFPLARLTARFHRPTVIAGALVVFALATLVTSAAPSYSAALASRLVAAGATGLLWSTVNAHAAAIVPEHRIARAAAVVLFGGMLGTVAGVPAGNAIAGLATWRVPFAGLGLLALLAAGAVALVLRGQQVPAPAIAPARGLTSRPSLAPLLATAGFGSMVLAAHFIVFTFVAELLAPSSVPIPVLLVVFGLVGGAGVVLVGLSSDRYPDVVPVVMALVMVVSLAALPAIGVHGGLDLLLVAVWGMVTGAVGPAVQASVMRRAGVEHRSTAGTLMPVSMNLGIAVGAGAGSGVLDHVSLQGLPLLAALPAIVAVAGFTVLARRGANRR